MKERLLPDSKLSLWDKISLLKLKTHSTWMQKAKVKSGDKVIKLREERSLLSRFLVIQQARPDLVPRLASIGDYELAVIL